MQTLEEKILSIIESPIEKLGFRIVQLKVIGDEARKILQIMAENLDYSGINLDECADISRNVSALLDVEDVFASAFTLEVSSPGIERPLLNIEDFNRYQNQPIKVKLSALVDERKRFRGDLLKIEDNVIYLKEDDSGEEISFPYDIVEKANLWASDEVINNMLKEA